MTYDVTDIVLLECLESVHGGGRKELNDLAMPSCSPPPRSLISGGVIQR